MTEIPTTRWAAGGAATSRYLERFSASIDAGNDVDGEARLADVLVSRGARILDAGAGMGRVAIALQRKGHKVLAAEPDASLVAVSQQRWPELPVVTKDILELSAETEGSFDLITAVGNVMVLLAEGTEVRVLSTLRSLLATNGRILVGFNPQQGPTFAREYPFDEFATDVAAAGLRIQHHFGGYNLEPANDEYVVVVLEVSNP